MGNRKIAILFLAFAIPAFAREPVDYVNTLVGSMSKPEFSTGNTYPCVSMPWGTHSWTPQTGKMGSGWIYSYTDSRLRGFRMTHQPSPWINDYGQFSIMPVTTGAVYKEEDRASWFSHKAETATPYYYSVYLAEHDVFVEVRNADGVVIQRLYYDEAGHPIGTLEKTLYPNGNVHTLS